MYLQRVGFYVDKTQNGQLMVNVYISSGDDFSLVQQGQISGALMGTSVLETYPFTAEIPFEAQQERFWHAVYCQGEGNTVQLQLTMSPEQITTPDIAFSGFVLNAFTIYAKKTNNYF
jgi:hypothetical protein